MQKYSKYYKIAIKIQERTKASENSGEAGWNAEEVLLE